VPADSQYAELPRPRGELQHQYGPQVRILSHPWAMTMLAQLCAEETHQPLANDLVKALYDWLLAEVASREFAAGHTVSATRMAAYHPNEGVYEGELLDREQKVVVVDIARAGIIPGMRFFDGLNRLLLPSGIRQDHVFMNRVTNEAGEVTGVDMSGSKIGGPIDGATVIIPDPMAATGSSTGEVLRLYQEEVEGEARQMLAVHLIVTPEYVKRITTDVPDTRIYAIRLDRGLSAADVLQTIPGERWSDEKGLNQSQYIVPGGGGFGEVMNNAWV